MTPVIPGRAGRRERGIQTIPGASSGPDTGLARRNDEEAPVDNLLAARYSRRVFSQRSRYISASERSSSVAWAKALS